MGHRLRDDVTFCIADGRAVFLDLRADRYFCLSRRSDTAFRQLAEGGLPGDGDKQPIELLERDGLLIGVAGDAFPEATFGRPASRSFAESTGSVSGALLLATMASQVVMSASLRMLPLHATVARLGRRKAALRDRAEAPLSSHGMDCVAAAWRAERILSSTDRCLARSLALMRALLARDCAVDLVIAVRTTPFAAHCWVQHDDTVLNDTVEHTRLYTPILVV